MSMWRLWHDNRTIKQIQEDLSELYEQPNPQKAWIKAMYEQDKTFRKYIDTIEKKLKRDWDFICFEDRDAYLLYTLIDEYYWQNQMHNASYKLICAEDLSGNVEGKDFVGKKVLILGIVLNRRLKMFECYCQLKKLGVGPTVSIVFGFNVDAYGFKDYEEVHQSRINQIYCGIFGNSEENIFRTKECLKDWYYQLYGDVYYVSEGISKVQMQILNLFHRNSYLEFEKMYGDSDEAFVFEIVRGIVMRSTAHEGNGISIQEIKEELSARWENVIDDVMQLMKELSIIEERVHTNGKDLQLMLQQGKNADWLMRGEGKLCYLCAEPLYIMFRKSKQEFISHQNRFLQEAREICSDICYDYREPFSKRIFDSYIEWYSSMTLNDVEHYISAQRIWVREGTMTSLEQKIHDEMIKRAEDVWYNR